MTMTSPRFWKHKTLDQLDKSEWEALCDGCGKCCLHKLQDDDTEEVHYTNVACRLLDLTTISCSNYPERKRFVPDCVFLTPEIVAGAHWLPESCAYRCVADGRPLADWHPLISGNKNSTVDAGQSIKSFAIAEQGAGDLEEHLIKLDDA